MNCFNCLTPNADDAKFCKNCGTSLYFTKTPKSPSDILLIVFITIGLIVNIGQFIIQQAFDNWYQAPIKYAISGAWILQCLSFILLPLAIKDTSLKTVGFILAAIWIIYGIYSNVIFLIR